MDLSFYVYLLIYRPALFCLSICHFLSIVLLFLCLYVYQPTTLIIFSIIYRAVIFYLFYDFCLFTDLYLLLTYLSMYQIFFYQFICLSIDLLFSVYRSVSFYLPTFHILLIYRIGTFRLLTISLFIYLSLCPWVYRSLTFYLLICSLYICLSKQLIIYRSVIFPLILSLSTHYFLCNYLST